MSEAEAAAAAAAAAAVAPMSEYAVLRASLDGFKKALSRQINKATSILAAHGVSRAPSTAMLTELSDQLSRTKGTFGRMEAVYDKLKDGDPSKSSRYEDGLAIEDARCSTVVANMVEVIAKLEFELSPATRSVAPAVAASVPKAVSVLQPKFALSFTHTTNQMTNWVEQFQTYYTSSHLEKATVVEQQGHFRSCMDPVLFERIKVSMKPDTPIFGANSCVTLVEKEFLRQYPLFSRRLEFFRSVQPASMPFSEWTAALRLIGDQAELGKIKLADLYVMRYFCGISDGVLLDELMKLHEPTLAQLDAAARHYEMNVLNKNKIHSASSAVHAVSAGGGKSGSGSDKKNKKKFSSSPPSTATTKDERIKELKAAGKCTRCNRKWESNHDCPAASGTCNKCGAAGHYSPVCLADLPAAPKSNSVTVEAATSVVIASSTAHRQNEPTPRMKIQVNSNHSFCFSALPDSGTTRSIISVDVARRNKIEVHPGAKETITVANGDRIACEGWVELPVTFEGLTLKLNFLASNGIQNDIYLCWQDLIEFGVLPPNFPHRCFPAACSATLSKN